MLSFKLIRCLLILVFGLSLAEQSIAQQEAEAYSGVTESRLMFQENCAVCHGESLEGTGQGSPLRGSLIHGESIEAIVTSITNGYEVQGMPSWRDIFSPTEIRGLAMYLMETRNNVGYVTSNYDTDFTLPDEVFETSLHDFSLEIIAEDLDPLPFSIEPMPNGDILVTEKTKGVRIIRQDGERSDLIQGTPTAFDDIYRLESRIDIERGMGWLFAVSYTHLTLPTIYSV